MTSLLHRNWSVEYKFLFHFIYYSFKFFFLFWVDLQFRVGSCESTERHRREESDDETEQSTGNQTPDDGQTQQQPHLLYIPVLRSAEVGQVRRYPLVSAPVNGGQRPFADESREFASDFGPSQRLG